MRRPGTAGRDLQSGRGAEPGGGRALLLALTGIVLSWSLLPWGPLGLALEIAAVYLGVRTLRRGRASGRPAPGALAAVVAGGMAVLFFVVALTFVGFFYDEYSDYERCVGRAITDSASQDCQTEFERAVRERLGFAP